MRIFVVNCGSSSIKYQLFDMADESVLAKGLLERIGTATARLHHSANGRRGESQLDREIAAPDHTTGLKIILDALTDPKIGVLDSIDGIDGVGHRVVHGGEETTASARIDDRLIALIRRNIDLAPLHNPPNLAGIEAAMATIRKAAHVAVFDTAFLSTLPPKAYRYAVPADWYAKHHVRRYGFHGTSHRYVTLRAAQLLGKQSDKVNLITCHLGNGCSMTAVAGGKAVDHSMGMTPLEGLVMGTRCGDIDPAIVLRMIDAGMSAAEVDDALNKASGLLGLSGLSNDMRDLLAAADAGNAKAQLAVEVFAYRVAKYVGAYFTILLALDAVVFTGGIGENSVPVRRMVCRYLARLGATLDESRNRAAVGGKAGPITADGSRLPVWVIPTNEELMIARDTAAIVGQHAG
jgi:acetate kinase